MILSSAWALSPILPDDQTSGVHVEDGSPGFVRSIHTISTRPLCYTLNGYQFMKINAATLSKSILPILLLSSCAHYATISERVPKFRLGNGPLGTVEKRISQGLKIANRDPIAALAEYISAVDAASKQLTITPDDRVVQDDYNFAVARIV